MVDKDKKGRDLTDEEIKEMKMGFDVEEMTKTAGWKNTISRWLEDRGYHTWVDPRGLTEDEWKWAELNAFHSADVSKQLIEDIAKVVQRARYLYGIKIGEIKEYKRMRV
jgi:hypothetical protein